MVFTDILCAMNLAASVMVSGVCCYYQMNEENESRKEQEIVIMKAFRKELDVHRQKQMILKRDELVKAYTNAVSYRLQDERRQKLMAQKLNLIVAGTNTNYSMYQPAECDRVKPIAMDTNHPIVATNYSFSSTVTKKSESIFLSKFEPTKFLGQRSVDGKKLTRNISLESGKIKTVSSFLDYSLSENSNSFEEICIE